MNAQLAEARRWIRFAEEDLHQAEHILEQEDFVPRHPCWLAQQAAEKAMKAVLIAASIRFPRTHDLDHLHTLVPSGRAVGGTAADLSALSEYAVDARYPGDWPDVTAEDAHAAVSDARLLVRAAQSDVPARDS